MPKFYTSVILLINQLKEIDEKQFSFSGSRGGQNGPLMHVTLSELESISGPLGLFNFLQKVLTLMKCCLLYIHCVSKYLFTGVKKMRRVKYICIRSLFQHTNTQLMDAKLGTKQLVNVSAFISI